jgi:hypothetical protein
LNGLRVRLYDKLARINHALDSGGQVDFDDDSFRDAFLDVVGYGLIGLLVLDGKWPGAAPAEKPLGDYIEMNPIFAEIDSPVYTHRWSSIYHPPRKKASKKPDSWPIGTTFQPDPPGCWLWTRHAAGWSAEGRSTYFPNLRAAVDSQHYSDGIITEPSTSKEEAA